jgi:NAD(P)H-hydrate epimerase
MKNDRPVISSSTYLKVEKQKLISDGAITDAMEKVGRLFFERTLEFLRSYEEVPTIVLLIGKGNNGADAFVVGRHLLKCGLKVVAIEFFEESKNQFLKKEKEAFLSFRGELIPFDQLFLFQSAVLIDGIFGSGFKGSLDLELEKKFIAINSLKFATLSLDAPSGVSGDMGTTGVAISATETFYIDFPRMGFFLEKAPNYLGRLIPIYLDLVSLDEIKQEVSGFLVTKSDIHLPEITRKRHKYEAGLVVAWCGSKRMKGAANLSTAAALKVGAGIVKLLSFPVMDLSVSEVVQIPFKETKKALIKAGACMVGPGVTRSLFSKLKWKFLFNKIKSPLVIDADALFLASLDQMKKKSTTAIFTPHRKECVELLKKDVKISDAELIQAIKNSINKEHLYLVLKGCPTFVFYQNGPPLIFYGGDPGMATAGSGDVLTGMIAGFLAQKMEPLEAISTAVYLHQLCGELAALDLTSYNLTANSLLAYLPAGFKELLSR